MSTTQTHVEFNIRRTVSRPIAKKPDMKSKSAGALRMARLRREQKELLALATKLRAEFFNKGFDMLAKSNPNGSSITGARMIMQAWLRAGHVPPATRKYLTAHMQ